MAFLLFLYTPFHLEACPKRAIFKNKSAPEPMAQCKNCKRTIESKYCPYCGQRASVGDLQLRDVAHESWHAITHTDKGILKLLKDQALFPGRFYDNYFSGKRKRYFNPVTFFLIAAAILLFIGLKIFDYEDYIHRAANPNGYNEFGRYIFHATKFKTLLLLPVEIGLTWLLFGRQYNLAKQIAFWLLLHGFLFTIQILFTPVYFLFIQKKPLVDNAVLIIQYAITTWHLVAVFGKRRWLHILACFLITNILIVTNFVLSGYLLFGKDILEKGGYKNIFELIKGAYIV